MPINTTLIMINGLEIGIPIILEDKCKRDRDRLLKKIDHDYNANGKILDCKRAAWNDKPIDLNTIKTKVMLVGHSFGGDACLQWIQRAGAKAVDCLILLDPVPNRQDSEGDALRNDPNYKFPIPSNVLKCIAYHRTIDEDVWTHSKRVVVDRELIEQIELPERHENFFTNSFTVAKIRKELDRLTGGVPSLLVAAAGSAVSRKKVAGRTSRTRSKPKPKPKPRAKATSKSPNKPARKKRK